MMKEIIMGMKRRGFERDDSEEKRGFLLLGLLCIVRESELGVEIYGG